MRILTFLHSFEPGGVERVALRLVRAWREDGADAPLLMGREDGAMRAELADGLSYDVPRQPFFGSGWFETLWMILILPGAIRRLRPDVLFCAGNSYTIVIAAMKLILGRNCPPVVAKISNDLARPDLPWAIRPFYRMWLRIQGMAIDRFAAMERPMSEQIAAMMNVPRDRISVIPNPVLSMAQIDALAARHGDARAVGKGRRFVAVGRLAKQKNLPMMLQAFSQGAQSGDTLTLLGEGQERRSVEREIIRLGLQGRVTLAGHVHDPAGQLHRFDILLLSSDYEGVPAVVLEGFAAGLPAIVTNCCASMAALVDSGKLGTLVPRGDVAAMAHAIAAARAGTQDRAAALAQARRFTIDNACNAYLRLFHRCVPHAGSAKNIFAAD